MTSDSPSERNVESLRGLMQERGLDAYIVPSADPHQTEYAHAHWRCRAWLTGFTGSAGTAVVLKDAAGLWTDGRYFIQAEQELAGSGVDLFKDRMEGVPTMIDWTLASVPEGGSVGVDGRLVSSARAKEWERKLAKKSIELVLEFDLISPIWEDRPPLPKAPASLWPVEFAGRSAADKLAEIRAAMEEKGADAYLLSSLYDIAWLFNIRGDDTPRCPILTAHALVETDRATLFTDEEKISAEIRAALETEGVSIAAYETISHALKSRPASGSLYLCPGRVAAGARRDVACEVIEGNDLTDLPKARKNAVELANWRTVHEIDGVAMVRFWKWFEENAPAGGVDELSAAERLERFRRSDPDCVDLSFNSISAYGANAAMTHYAPSPENNATLESNGLYLIDSGGQYLGGTTDITRVFALGDPTDEQREDYTLTLKGVIGLSSAIFLKGAAGNNLDVLARRPLWERGLDYNHGTGHGVGCYLNVHEGPHNLSQAKRSDTPFEPGMVVTIEPGVYKEGRHGIRIENMVVVEEERETECGVFYRFGTLTLCPIDVAPLKLELMSAAEIAWLNDYHATVRAKLAPRLSAEEAAWLERKTAAIG